VLTPIFGLMGKAVDHVRGIFDGLIKGTFAKFTPALNGITMGGQRLTEGLHPRRLNAAHGAPELRPGDVVDDSIAKPRELIRGQNVVTRPGEQTLGGQLGIQRGAAA